MRPLETGSGRSRGVGLLQLGVAGEQGDLHPVLDVQLDEEATDVRLDGGHAQVQRRRDLGVVQPAADAAREWAASAERRAVIITGSVVLAGEAISLAADEDWKSGWRA